LDGFLIFDFGFLETFIHHSLLQDFTQSLNWVLLAVSHSLTHFPRRPDQPDRKPRLCVTGPNPQVMLLHSPFQVIRGSAVKAAVGASEKVNLPGRHCIPSLRMNEVEYCAYCHWLEQMAQSLIPRCRHLAYYFNSDYDQTQQKLWTSFLAVGRKQLHHECTPSRPHSLLNYRPISDEELRKAINLMTFEHGETEIWLSGKK
jgi:hypothetical protein